MLAFIVRCRSGLDPLGSLRHVRACEGVHDALVGLDEALPMAHRRDLGPLWILWRLPVPSAGVKDDSVMESLTKIAVASQTPVVPANVSNSEPLRSSNQKLQKHKHCVVRRRGRRLGTESPNTLYQVGVSLLPRSRPLGGWPKLDGGVTEAASRQ